MKKTNKTSTLFRSYELNHKANPSKVDALFELYQIYKYEYKFHIKQYWNLFLKNKIKNNKFSQKEIARTTEDQGLDPMTALNFDKYLIDFYQLRSKI